MMKQFYLHSALQFAKCLLSTFLVSLRLQPGEAATVITPQPPPPTSPFYRGSRGIRKDGYGGALRLNSRRPQVFPSFCSSHIPYPYPSQKL